MISHHINLRAVSSLWLFVSCVYKVVCLSSAVLNSVQLLCEAWIIFSLVEGCCVYELAWLVLVLC